MTVQFRKAARTAVKLKVLVTGPSGSGKTLGALRIAEGLAPGKIALLDSENDRSSYYADRVDFDVLTLTDADPKTYLAGMQAAVEAGYEVVIIDSLSHAWQNVLDRKTEYDAANPKSNGFANWKRFGGEWDRMIRGILDLPVHVIATARSKQAYEQSDREGSKKIVKLGMAPTIREGTEYEFALHLDLNEQHWAEAKKDNLGAFGEPGKLWNLCDGSVAGPIRGWLAGAQPVEKPSPETLAAMDEAIAGLPAEAQPRARMRWASRREKGVTDQEAREMLAAMTAKAGAA